MARKQIHIDYELLGNIVERKLDWAITAIKQKRFETSRMNSVSESKHSSIAIEASSIPIAN